MHHHEPLLKKRYTHISTPHTKSDYQSTNMHPQQLLTPTITTTTTTTVAGPTFQFFLPKRDEPPPCLYRCPVYLRDGFTVATGATTAAPAECGDPVAAAPAPAPGDPDAVTGDTHAHTHARTRTRSASMRTRAVTQQPNSIPTRQRHRQQEPHQRKHLQRHSAPTPAPTPAMAAVRAEQTRQ